MAMFRNRLILILSDIEPRLIRDYHKIGYAISVYWVGLLVDQGENLYK